MDSGNSTGSMQSSSTNGGDEESYDSRADSSSISAFLNNVGPMSNPPPPAQPSPHHPHHNHSFDQYSLSNYHHLNPTSNLSRPPISSNSLLNLDMVWSKTLRSDPNCTDLLVGGGGFMASSSSPSASSQQLLTNQITLQNRISTTNNNNNFNHFPPPGADTSVSGINIDQTNNNINSNNNSSNNSMVRNPKKRSRASRRAPTTVLTTDTNNFRAMVQEFTGIPAPPFTSTSPFPRTRLDLFGGMSSSFMRSSTTTNTNLDPSPPPPPYLLRPFPHKIQPQPQSQSLPFVNNSTMVDAIASTSSSTATTTTTTTPAATNITSESASNGNISNSNSTSINYQLLSGPPSHHHHNQQSLLNMNMQLQNPIFNIQSLLQAPTKPSLDNNIPSNHDLKIGMLEELGLSSHGGGGGGGGGHLSGLQNMVSPSTSTSTSSDMVGTLSMAMRNNTHHTITNNFLASSISDFNGDHKVLQENNVGATTTRTEGMVESWICSSD